MLAEISDNKNWWDLVTVGPKTAITQKRLSNVMWDSILSSARKYELRFNSAIKRSNQKASDIQMAMLNALCDITSGLHANNILDQRYNRNFKELYDIQRRMKSEYDNCFNIEILYFPE